MKLWKFRRPVFFARLPSPGQRWLELGRHYREIARARRADAERSRSPAKADALTLAAHAFDIAAEACAAQDVARIRIAGASAWEINNKAVTMPCGPAEAPKL